MRYSVDIANGIWDANSNKQWTTNVSGHGLFKPDLRYQLRNEYAFVILRCPFARLASAFLDQFNRRPHSYLTYRHQDGVMAKLLDPAARHLVNFEKFVKKLESNWKFLHVNAHWSPQVEFLLYEDYDDYFSVEKFGKAVDTLEKKIELKIYDMRKTSKHGIDGFKKVSITNAHKLNVNDIISMRKKGEIINPQSLFSQEMYDVVCKLYDADIKLYKEKIGEETLMFEC
ncbi:sulfotransferase family 2 domain-containing protein [Fulvivirga sp. 29W222]|uniref:Sulfotransferase family 2 domain-containing protein n=2 Tax=Fulvivirga marina TaxID=2494733 RepID=A0A937FZH9_9BACT|nr:sulfotransferase family 2 domain-containing protein [Fulvivirga marina]